MSVSRLRSNSAIASLVILSTSVSFFFTVNRTALKIRLNRTCNVSTFGSMGHQVMLRTGSWEPRPSTLRIPDCTQNNLERNESKKHGHTDVPSLRNNPQTLSLTSSYTTHVTHEQTGLV